MLGIFIFRMELVLRRPLGEPPFQLFPSLRENGESSCRTSGLPLAADRETDPTVMMLLAIDKEEIEGKGAHAASQKHIKLNTAMICSG